MRLVLSDGRVAMASPRHPDVRLHVFEGYSGLLTDMVLADDLDFAVVASAIDTAHGVNIDRVALMPR